MRTFDSPAIVVRKRVCDRLEAAAARPVTLVIAPAGCGKSTALQQHVSAIEGPVIRYDVRRENANLLGFMRGFTDAVRMFAPSARGAVAEAVQSALTADRPGEALADWMSAHLSEFAGTIAIDDLHVCQKERDCVDFVVAYIERTKAKTRWILATRSWQNLPIGSWTVYGDADVPVGELDLRFTAEEARAVATAFASPLAQRDVDRLFMVTNGWATALTLALRVSKVHPDPNDVAATARDLTYDFLAEHVYRSLDENERSLLRFCAMLPEFDPVVADRAGYCESGAALERVRKAFNVLQPLDPAAAAAVRRYRCHDLFREFLLDRAESEGDAALRGLRLRAAGALRDCGNDVEALRLFAGAGAREEILAILRDTGLDIAQRAHGDTLRAAIDALPESDRASEAIVLGLLGQEESSNGRYQRAAALFERALAASSDAPMAATMLAHLGYCRFCLDEPVLPLLERTTGAGLPLRVRAEVLASKAISLAKARRWDELPALLNELETLAPQIDSEVARAVVLGRVGIATYFSGQSLRCARVFGEAVRLATANGMYRAATNMYLAMAANALANDGDPTAAIEPVAKAMETAKRSGSPHHHSSVRAVQLDVAFFVGDEDEMRRLVAASEPDISSMNAATLLKMNSVLAAFDGDFVRAVALLSEGIKRSKFDTYRMLGNACAALWSAAAGRKSEAAEYTKQSTDLSAESTSDQPAFGRFAELSRALCAIAEAMCGRHAAADRILARPPLSSAPVALAARLAAESAIAAIRTHTPPVDLERQLERLRECSYGTFARLIAIALERMKLYRADGITLTPAEIGVLRALALGQAPKEIAASAGCSVHTVRWHIKQAIGKFDCSGRDQAIHLARSHGLI